MSDTRELVDPAQVGAVLAVISGVALVAAAGLMMLGRMRGRHSLVRTALICSAGILAYPLWLVYNRIEDQLGLDSVLALLLNLALFVVVGVVGGLTLRRLWPEEAHRSDTETQRLAQTKTEG